MNQCIDIEKIKTKKGKKNTLLKVRFYKAKNFTIYNTIRNDILELISISEDVKSLIWEDYFEDKDIEKEDIYLLELKLYENDIYSLLSRLINKLHKFRNIIDDVFDLSKDDFYCEWIPTLDELKLINTELNKVRKSNGEIK